MYRGSPIGRKELVCLFASVLKREADGDFWLETPAERGRIEVEDAPFVAVELNWTGVGPTQELTFRTTPAASSPVPSFRGSILAKQAGEMSREAE